LTTEFEFGYFTSAVISAQKNADFPVKVSPHRSFDLFNQIAVIACQRPTAFVILAQVVWKMQTFS
jgi:hypothetical protein